MADADLEVEVVAVVAVADAAADLLICPAPVLGMVKADFRFFVLGAGVAVPERR
jgi:hypothetical protein